MKSILRIVLAASVAILAGLLFRAQPTCAQVPCFASSCIVGQDAVCGRHCLCAPSGPAPSGVCVNR